LLSEFPGLGRPRDELAESLRSFPVGNYVIFYLPLGDGINVIRVLHGARDIRRRMFRNRGE
jgi:toxin ParE1/3/4